MPDVLIGIDLAKRAFHSHSSGQFNRFSVGSLHFLDLKLGLDQGPIRGVDFRIKWCYFCYKQREINMRSTINLDDNLMERAKSLTGTKETAALIRQALETLVRVESGKRLIALGGSMADAEAAPRRRSEVIK